MARASMRLSSGGYSAVAWPRLMPLSLKPTATSSWLSWAHRAEHVGVVVLEPAERHVHHARARVASQDDDVGHLPERAVLGKLARGEATPRPFAVVASDR
eukprot:scaffold64621_cov84-Phaeocystis_antarctica.AAC.1